MAPQWSPQLTNMYSWSQLLRSGFKEQQSLELQIPMEDIRVVVAILQNAQNKKGSILEPNEKGPNNFKMTSKVI
jgi:hypothetical protein